MQDKNNKTTVYGDIAAGIIFIIGFIGVISLLGLLIWDVGVAWLLPNTQLMNYGNALALSTAIVAVHMLINFWVNKRLQFKQAQIVIKSIEATIAQYAKKGDEEN